MLRLYNNLGGRVQLPVQPCVKISNNACGVPFKFCVVRLYIVLQYKMFCISSYCRKVIHVCCWRRVLSFEHFKSVCLHWFETGFETFFML